MWIEMDHNPVRWLALVLLALNFHILLQKHDVLNSVCDGQTNEKKLEFMKICLFVKTTGSLTQGPEVHLWSYVTSNTDP
jgi:hypothetical protein